MAVEQKDKPGRKSYPVDPILVDRATAARTIGMSVDYLDDMVDQGVFTEPQRHGAGRNCKYLYYFDELKLYAEANKGSNGTAGREAVLAFRRERGRL